MNFFLDTEFIEDGKTIDLISIGMIDEEGNCFYRINGDCDLSKASDWVVKNVLGKMPEYDNDAKSFIRSDIVVSRSRIASDVVEFVKPMSHLNCVSFWGYFADYDWVAFCQLFGTMMQLPKGFPMYCKDLKQEMERVGMSRYAIPQEDTHNALSDAKWNKAVHGRMKKMGWL